MIKLTYKLILLLVIACSITLQASEPILKKEITREVHETFDVSPGVRLAVENKYGDITIDTWEKNQIQIDVLIKVKSSDTENAKQFLNDIEIRFSSSPSRVEALTVYPDNKKSWWSGWFGDGKNLDYEVHYTIKAPGKLSTSIVNKYGNITQESIDGESNVENKYGDIFCKNVSGDFDLTLGYGKATIGEVGEATMQIKYSSLKVIETKDLEITTKYSNIKIKRCENVTSYSKYDDFTIESLVSLKNDGKYDDFTIGTVNEINIDTKYTDLNIGTLNHSGIFETGYGHVRVKSSGPNLEKVSISSKYTEYDFNLERDFHLKFDGSRATLNMSPPYEKYESHRDGSDLKVKAYRGSKEGGVKIIASMKYGGLDIN